MDSQPPQHLLGGLTVAIVADTGFEQVEMTGPREALQAAGAVTRLLSVSRGQIRGFHHDQPGDLFDVDMALEDVHADDFDAVLLPGGVRNADMLRTSRHAQQFVRDMDAQGKPLGVICHGPWLLISAGLVQGRTLTSWPTLQDDIRNAQGNWVDREVVIDRNWVSSRKPADLPAFNERFEQLLAARTLESVAGSADEADSAAGTGG